MQRTEKTPPSATSSTGTASRPRGLRLPHDDSSNNNKVKRTKKQEARKPPHTHVMVSCRSLVYFIHHIMSMGLPG